MKNIYLILIAALVVGTIFGGLFSGTVEETPQEPVKAECNYDDWKELKLIDDELIAVEAEGYLVLLEGIEYAVDLDSVGVEKTVDHLEQNRIALTAIKARREEALRGLGY